VQQSHSDIKFVDQTTYAEFIMSLSNPSASYTFNVAPLNGPVVLDFPLHIAHYFTKQAMDEGSDGALNEEERGVLNTVLKNVLKEFEAFWAPVEKVQVSNAMLETNPEVIGIAEPGDTVVLIGFEIHFQHANGVVSLAYPYKTLESVLPKFSE
jgi:flagellar motor switch protein FliM